MLYIKKFSEIHISNVNLVGGKNASLGEMFNSLTSKGILIPDGFATTAAAFYYFLDYNSIATPLKNLLAQLDSVNFKNLKEIGKKAREIMEQATMPEGLSKEIIQAYLSLSGKEDIEVAVRSSATAEDLPQASFAGQHESYLNIKGEAELLKSVQRCFASLYTDRAIKYRVDNGFAHEEVALSVGVQKMVRSDKACSGVA
ncbi:MAG: PEP/pyruvate-binding domain-containing protein, partial [Ginsengibacter sp.]